MIFSISHLVTRRHHLCLALSWLLSFPFLLQLPYVQTVDNVDYFTIEDDPDVAFYKTIKDTFGDDEFFVIAFSSPEMFTPPVLRMIATITKELEAIPEVEEVQSLANVDYIHGAEEYFEVRPFLEHIPDNDTELKVLRQQAVSNPLYVGNLISADGNTAAIVVSPKTHGTEDVSFRKRLLEQTKTVLHIHKDFVDQFHLAGWTMTNFSLSQFMNSDVATFIPLTYLFIILTIWLTFRNQRLTLLALVNISICTGTTMGLFPLLGTTLNNVTAIVPPLVMALALTDTVHIFSHLEKNLLAQTQSPAEALQAVLKRVLVPCFLTSLTTAVGFVSLVVSDIPPIKEFGYVASLGMVFEFFFSFMLLPPLLLLCKPEKIFIHDSQGQSLNAFLKGLSNFVHSYPRRISIVTALLLLGALGAASTIKVETNLLEYFKPSSSLRRELEHVESRLSGVGTVDVSLKTQERDAFRDPANLAVIERVQSFAKTLPSVDRSISVVDFLKDMNKSFHDENQEFYRIPDSRELISQYLLLYDSDDLNDFVTTDFNHARILIRISEHNSAGQARIITALRTFIEQNENNGLQIRVTGRAVQDVNTIDALVQGQIQSLTMAAGVISLIMFLAMRSLAIGFLSLIPNMVPIILNFGIMGALGIPLNTSTALISVIGLGIAVDDTIHFLTEYNLRRAEKMPIAETLRRVTMDKGLGICSSSVILFIGFSVLMFSNFVPTMSFGFLSAAIMITAWIGDMIVLPAVVLSFCNKKG
jgi:hypothetical protein